MADIQPDNTRTGNDAFPICLKTYHGCPEEVKTMEKRPYMSWCIKTCKRGRKLHCTVCSIWEMNDLPLGLETGLSLSEPAVEE